MKFPIYSNNVKNVNNRNKQEQEHSKYVPIFDTKSRYTLEVKPIMHSELTYADAFVEFLNSETSNNLTAKSTYHLARMDGTTR